MVHLSRSVRCAQGTLSVLLQTKKPEYLKTLEFYKGRRSRSTNNGKPQTQTALSLRPPNFTLWMRLPCFCDGVY